MQWLGRMGLAVAFSSATSLAHGQEDEPERARVVLDGASPSVQLRLTRVADDETLLRCDERCAFSAPVGRYRVLVRDASTGAEYELALRVKHSGEYRLRQGDATARSIGLALGIAGPVMVAGGIVMLLQSFSQWGGETRAKVGLGIMAAGAAITPVGWVTYARNRTKLVLLEQEASAPVRFRVGIGAAPGGLGLAGVATF